MVSARHDLGQSHFRWRLFKFCVKWLRSMGGLGAGSRGLGATQSLCHFRASYLTFPHGLEPCQIQKMAADQHFTQYLKPNLKKNFLQFTEEVICIILKCHPRQLGEKTKNYHQFTSQTPSCLYTYVKKLSVCSRQRAFVGIEEVNWIVTLHSYATNPG